MAPAIPPQILNAINRRGKRVIPPAQGARAPAVMHGLCIHVPDGDGMSVLSNGAVVSVRLWGIDAPEIGQRYAQSARNVLMRLALRQVVYFARRDICPYGRTVAQVATYHAADLGLIMLLNGLAWHLPRFTNHDPTYGAAMRYARFYRRGIWHDNDVAPPWKFRHARRTQL